MLLDFNQTSAKFNSVVFFIQTFAEFFSGDSERPPKVFENTSIGSTRYLNEENVHISAVSDIIPRGYFDGTFWRSFEKLSVSWQDGRTQFYRYDVVFSDLILLFWFNFVFII